MAAVDWETDMSKNAAYLARKRVKAAQRNRERFTGWSHEEYQAAFIKQKGCCAMCHTHQSELKTALAADHDHETGRKRGLLCQRCNQGLGFLKDSIDLLKAAIVYLLRYQ